MTITMAPIINNYVLLIVRFNRTLWQVIKQLENEVLAISEIISWVEVSVILINVPLSRAFDKKLVR